MNMNMKYFLYARKSTEGEDQQIQSIPDQIKILEKVAKENHLEVIEILKEEKSAKKSGREIFDYMIKQIVNNPAENYGILSYNLSRISRNPEDSGKIIGLLQTGVIKTIRTPERQYLPTDNVLLMYVEFGMSNQFLRDLSQGVKRGLQSKIEKGWKPGQAPMGYLNDKYGDKGDKKIFIDPERFGLIQRMWKLLLSGTYSVPQVIDIANNEWGFRTKVSKKRGNNKLIKSSAYAIFTNPFYAGIYFVNGQQYQGKHEPMITIEEFDRVQKILGREGKPRPKTHTFNYTGTFKCGECGCFYTAEVKTKLLRKTNELANYTYYHCTRKKKDYKCTQKQHIREELLEEQILNQMDQVTILPEFFDWGMEVLHEEHKKESEGSQTLYESIHKALEASIRQRNKLIDMSSKEMISEEDFKEAYDKVCIEIKDLEQNEKSLELKSDDWAETAINLLTFLKDGKKSFLEGDPHTKKQILLGLGSNFLIMNGKLNLELSELLQPIQNGYKKLEEDFLRLEPRNSMMNLNQIGILDTIRTNWSGEPGSNRRHSPWQGDILPLNYPRILNNSS